LVMLPCMTTGLTKYQDVRRSDRRTETCTIAKPRRL
jgi:hypothetical protein